MWHQCEGQRLSKACEGGWSEFSRGVRASGGSGFSPWLGSVRGLGIFFRPSQVWFLGERERLRLFQSLCFRSSSSKSSDFVQKTDFLIKTSKRLKTESEWVAVPALSLFHRTWNPSLDWNANWLNPMTRAWPRLKVRSFIWNSPKVDLVVAKQLPLKSANHVTSFSQYPELLIQPFSLKLHKSKWLIIRG